MTTSVLITGGAGFIGSHLTEYLSAHYPDYRLIHLDKLMYPGCVNNVDICRRLPFYFFEHGDAATEKRVVKLFQEFDIRGVIHLAGINASEATLNDPKPMIDGNIQCLLTVLEAARRHWTTPNGQPKLGYNDCRFHVVSTGLVYGRQPIGTVLNESQTLEPITLYAASQASAEMIARSFYQTYGMHISISRLSAVFGPRQFNNRLIPAITERALAEKNLIMKAGGQTKQDWLYIDDCVRALDMVYHHASAGQIYNIGANNVYTNLEITRAICSILDIKRPRPNGRKYEELLRFSGEPTGTEWQVAMDCSKIKKELSWEPKSIFEVSLVTTIDNYLK